MRKWLEPFDWGFVTATNQMMCENKRAHHGPKSDGHALASGEWESRRQEEMTLAEAIDFCRQCHRMAPFTNFNGNTFSAIARTIIANAGFDPMDQTLARSLAGHIVAGVAEEGEVEAFRELCAKLGG
jgi:hypothetical protein